MIADFKIFFWLNNLAGQSPFFDGLIVFFADYLAYILVALFFVFLGLRQGGRRDKLEVFWAGAISATVARLGVTEIIRFFYHRLRPFEIYSVHQLIAESGYSFPSGHAAFFFALAAAVYGYDKKWGAGFFVASLLMGAGRVAAGVHYPSDVIGGMMIGVVVGYIVFRMIKAARRQKTETAKPPPA